MQLQAQCPVTNGLKTSMSEASFDALCKIKYEANSKGVPTYLHCQTCDERPKELTIKKFGGTVRMARKTGKCESCGKESTIQNHFGKGVCSMCLNLRSNVKNKPDVVVAALKEFGVIPVIENPVQGDSLNDAEDKITFLEKEIQHLKSALRDKPGNGLSALDQLAVGIMNGDISGVSADHYRELRG